MLNTCGCVLDIDNNMYFTVFSDGTAVGIVSYLLLVLDFGFILIETVYCVLI